MQNTVRPEEDLFLDSVNVSLLSSPQPDNAIA